MSDHRVVRLKEPGEKVTLRVAKVKFNANAEYPDYTFEGADVATGEPLWVNVPKAATERQVERLGYERPDELVGKVVTLKREANAKQPTKPYWAVYLEHPEDGGPMPDEPGFAEHEARARRQTPPSTPAQAPARPTPANGTAAQTTEDRLDRRYLRVTTFVLDQVLPEYRKREIPVDASAIAAMTATLFIQTNRER